MGQNDRSAGCIIFGVVISKVSQQCPSGQDCTSNSIMGAFLVVVGVGVVGIVALVGLWQDNLWVLRLGALMHVIFGFFLLLVAILLAMASGAISDLGAYYDENWPEIRCVCLLST